MKIPKIFLTDSEERLERLLKEKPKKKKEIENPRVGDDVYVPISYYRDRSEEDCLVALCKIADVKEMKIKGKKIPYIAVEGRPVIWYDWNHLQKYQEKWEEKYCDEKRRNIIPEFNC